MDERQQRFAARVAVLRAAQGLSFDAVGAVVGIAGETVRRYELGLSTPRGRRLVSRLEQALEADPGELWSILSGDAPPHAHGDDSDPRVTAILIELRELRAAVDELMRSPRDEDRVLRRARHPAVARQAS